MINQLSYLGGCLVANIPRSEINTCLTPERFVGPHNDQAALNDDKQGKPPEQHACFIFL